MNPLLVALWLARSCVGEAGFESAHNGECAAIAHVYKKRAEISGKSFYWVMRRYSAAIKPGHGKRWVMNLNRLGTKPPGFPVNWSVYKTRWLEVLKVADEFMRGKVVDPFPEALHYGGPMDRDLWADKRWIKVDDSRFRNYFYIRR